MLEFVCEMVADTLTEKKPPSVTHTTSFMASIISGAIKAGPEEDFIQAVLPYILSSNSSPNAELRATGLMLVAQLALHTAMEPGLSTGLLECIGDNLADPLLPDAIKTVVLLCQTQKVAALPASLSAFAATSGHFVKIMEDVTSWCDASAFVKLVFRAMLDAAAESADAIDGLLTFANGITLSTGLAKFLGALAIRRYRALPAGEKSTDLGERVAQETGAVLTRLEKMYPTAVDALLAETFAASGGDDSMELLKLVGGSARHQGVPGKDTSLFVGLQHTEPSVRAAAMGHLKKTLAAGQVVSDADRDFFQNSLRSGLADSDRAVVLGTLKLGKWLVDLLDTPVLFAALAQIIGANAKGKKGVKCFAAAVDVLVGPFADSAPGSADDILLVVLPGLFLSAKNIERYLVALKAVTESKALAGCALLAGAKKAAKGISADAGHEGANAKVIGAMAANVAKGAGGAKLADALCAAAAEATAASGLRQVVLLILSGAALKRPAADTTLQQRILTLATPMLGSEAACGEANAKVKRADADADADALWARTIAVTSSGWHATSETLEMRSTCTALAHLTKLVHTCAPLAGMADGAAVEFLVRVFTVLASRASSQALNRLMERFFLGLVAACPVEFLKHCWCSEVPLIVQVRSLHLTNAYIRSCTRVDKTGAILASLSGLVPHLVGALPHPDDAVRLAAVGCLTQVHALFEKAAAPKTGSAAAALVRIVGLVKTSSKELAVDPNALPALVARLVGAKNSPAFGDKDALVKVLLEAALATPHGRVTRALLAAVSGVSSASKFKVLWPALQAGLKKAGAAGTSYDALTATELAVARAALEGVDQKAVKLLTAKKGKEFAVLLQALQLGPVTEKLAEHPQTWALDLLVRDDLFDEFPLEYREVLFGALCQLLCLPSSINIAGKLRAVVAALRVNVHMIIKEWTKRLAPAAAAAADKPSSKRMRAAGGKAGSTADPEDEQVDKLRSTAPVLEILQFKNLKTIVKRSQLTTPLFEILRQCLALSAAAQPPVEHIKQTVLDNLSILCRFGGGKSFKEADIDTSLVVDCIKRSPSAQTHRHALLLLADIAAKHPQTVLDAIMPIFTFMGTNMLKRDDNHSFYIIEKTIETIIPVVVGTAGALEGAAGPKTSDIVSVVGVFVDAYSHVPKHRRLALFKFLLQALGADKYLFVVMALLLKRVILAKNTSSDEAAPQVFCLTVTKHFEVLDQMQAVYRLLQLLSDLPDRPDAAASTRAGSDAAAIFDAASHTPKQLRHFKYRIVSHLASNLSADSFIKARRVFERDQDEASMAVLRDLHFNTLKLALAYVVRQRNVEATNQGSAKFHATLTEHAFSIVDHLNALLSIPDFVAVVIRLLGHEDLLIREKVIVLLTERVTQADRSSPEERQAYLDTIGCLLKVVDAHLEGDNHAAKGRQTLCQAAVYGLTVLVAHFGRQSQEAFAPVLDTAVALLQADQLSGQFEVLASASACVGALAMALGKTLLPSLPVVLPCLLGILQRAENNDEDGNPPALLQSSVASSLTVLLKHVPQFLGPFMKEILRTVTHPSLDVDAAAEGDRVSSAKKAMAVRATIATNVPSRILLPPLYALYTEQVKSPDAAQVHSIEMLMEILTTSIKQIKRSEIEQHYKQLFKFFLTALECRGALADTMDVDAPAVEASIIGAFVQLVLQLSEKAFVPLLLKLIDWSARADAPLARQVTFLRTISVLTTELKALFVPYFSYFLRRMIAVLEGTGFTAGASLTSAPALTAEATTYTLTSLQHCFANDTDGFMNSERYTSLLTPLVAQLRCLSTEDSDTYMARVAGSVVPCLKYFPRTVKDITLWKDLNTHLLGKLQDSQAHVREAGLMVFEEIFQQQGDDFLNFLPDTVPLLVELLEDDSEVVEARCKVLVKQIEKILGESIQSYF